MTGIGPGVAHRPNARPQSGPSAPDSTRMRPEPRGETDRSNADGPGLVFCPPGGQREVIAGLTISFSMWQCAGHGDAAGLGFVH